MRLLKFYYQEFLRSDLLLKVLLISFVAMWAYNIIRPKRPMTSSSNLEAVLAYGFFALIIVASVGLFLALERKGGEIEWRGCETPESRTLVTKLLVRGGLTVCLIIGFI